jgi:predicted TIM-barrel fold metal-dependent hydrolase
MNRREALANLSALGIGATLAGLGDAQAAQGDVGQRRSKLRKIATEEAFAIPEIVDALREVVRAGGSNLDLPLLKTIYDAPAGTEPRFLPELLDLEKQRLADMDRNGVEVQVLSLTAPGVQMFDADTASSLAIVANDRLAEIVRRHPTRYAALASFAPQDPVRATKEMERSIKNLKFNGFIVNSHTNNEYLDQQRYWPILETAEALEVPLYIHPRAPSDGMAAPFRDYRLEGAAWGYGIEAGTHAVRLMLSGVLDRFPKLKIVIGHMGEALPFWMWRLDFMAAPGARAAGRTNQLKPSEYFQRNFAITTSGVEDPLALRYCIDKIGADNIMWAIDYPYQPTAPAVSFIESAPISEDHREKIAHKNAERIFRITAGR